MVGGGTVDLSVSKTLAFPAEHSFSVNSFDLQIIQINQDIVAAELFKCHFFNSVSTTADIGSIAPQTHLSLNLGK